MKDMLLGLVLPGAEAFPSSGFLSCLQEWMRRRRYRVVCLFLSLGVFLNSGFIIFSFLFRWYDFLLLFFFFF